MNNNTGQALLAELTRDLEIYATSQGFGHAYLVGVFHGILGNMVNQPGVQAELRMQLADVREKLRYQTCKS